MNQFYAALDVAVCGRRHRIVRKITDVDSRARAERNLVRNLRTALETLESLPQDRRVAGQTTLLALLDDLKRRLESRSASA